ncbi:MAG: DUF2934 domain-containing protein [Vicinamibacterales bacterium]
MSNPQAQYETADHVWVAAGSSLSTGLEHSLEMSERTPTTEEIAREAYAIYLAKGSQDGHDLDDWLEAEQRLIARHRSTALQQSGAVVLHTNNGESRQKSARLIADRRRNTRHPVPTYLPA